MVLQGHYFYILFNSSHSLAAVDDDIFRLDPFFQHSLFGMFASSSEQTWGLNLEVSNSFFVVIQQTVAIFIHYLLIGFFQSLQHILKCISHNCTLFAKIIGLNKRSLPVSPLCSCFFWLPLWLCAWREFLQSRTFQDLESVTSPLRSFPKQENCVS